ncbi:hypothetical protein Tco_0492934 [Tanacetum coccineum]
MTMHEVVHEMVVGECHEPNSEGSSSAWMAYMNVRVAGLFLLVLLDYPNGKGVVLATSTTRYGTTLVGSFAWMAHTNARVAVLFMLVLLEYPDGKGVVRATSRGLDMAPHWSGVGAALLMSPREDETSEPLLYAGWMAGPYRVEDATRGRNDDLVTSGIKAKSDRGGPKKNRLSCSPKKFLKVLAAQRWRECVPGMLKSQYDVVWSS